MRNKLFARIKVISTTFFNTYIATNCFFWYIDKCYICYFNPQNAKKKVRKEYLTTLILPVGENEIKKKERDRISWQDKAR